jgi:Fibronectin type III domain
VVRYQVTAVTRGATAPVGEADGAALVVPAGGLTYGTLYGFTVVAVNDRGASSAASPVSNSVTPYTRPGAPRNVRAATVNRRGTIEVTWQPAEENGRAIEHYVVTARGRSQEVRGTSLTLADLPDGESVQVSVRAVNAAGEGPTVQRSATTIAPPRVSLTGSTGAYSTITVNFSVVDGGSPPTCTLAINGGGRASGGCTSLTAGGVYPGRTYGWTLTVTNAAGTATVPGSTATRALTGTVICADPSYCGRGAPRGGIWVYRTPSQNGRSVGDVFSPEQYEALCQVPDAGGATINATLWGGKRSNMWVQIRYPAGQLNYIPFAWFRLAEGDNLGLLPRC